MSAIAQRDEEALPAPAGESGALISMIERVALNPAIDIDRLERLLNMQRDVMAENARKAFARDFSLMQPELPEIPERGKGHGNITYALWEDVNDLVKPVLAKWGFGLSFETGRNGTNLTVTAILSHAQGHEKRTTLEMLPDQSGSKNAIQAIGSSTSYGKRYTASALLNLTSRGEDDDGAKAVFTKPKEDARDPYAEMQAEIDACSSVNELSLLWQSRAFQEEFKTLPQDWRGKLISRKEERKRELVVPEGYVPPKFSEEQTDDIPY